MKLLHKCNNALLKAIQISTILFYLVMLVSASLQIVLRFVFKAPLAWTDEVAKYTFVWGTMLGCAYLVRTSKHSSVEVLRDALKGISRQYHAVFLDVFCLIFYVVIVSGGITLVQAGRTTLTPALGFPMWIIYLIMPIAGICMFLFQTENLIHHIKGEEV